MTATDTTSSAVSRTLHVLAEHPEVQQKLRDEIIAARAGRDQIPYDELIALPFLDAVCRETLRAYVHSCPWRWSLLTRPRNMTAIPPARKLAERKP